MAPVFFLLIFAGIEMGLMFRADLTVEDMTRNAARVGSLVRDDPEADRLILAEIERRVGTLSGEILTVHIFNAETLSSGLPPQCLNNGNPVDFNDGTVSCNSYSGADLQAIVDGTGGALGTAYPPEERQQWDILGVAVRYRQQSATGVIDGLTFTASTVEVIELDL